MNRPLSPFPTFSLSGSQPCSLHTLTQPHRYTQGHASMHTRAHTHYQTAQTHTQSPTEMHADLTHNFTNTHSKLIYLLTYTHSSLRQHICTHTQRGMHTSTDDTCTHTRTPYKTHTQTRIDLHTHFAFLTISHIYKKTHMHTQTQAQTRHTQNILVLLVYKTLY